MGIFDDVKNSITGSNDSGDQFDEDKYDSSFTSGDNSNNRGNSSLEPETGPGGVNDQNSQGPSPGPDQGQQQGPQQGQQPGMNSQSPEPQGPPGNSQRSGGTSNPQAGRPEKGSSRPQVSDDTRNKMQDAGFDFDQQNNQDRNPNGGHQQGHGDIGNDRSSREPSLNGGNERTTPVSDQQDDMEKIKAQNEQIIELLKRISHSLQDQSSDNTGSRRHGGRR